MELDLQGNIEQFTLPEILQLIATGRKSGTLGIQRDDSIVMIYFKTGIIKYGYGPRQTFHLGQLLKERGTISDQQLDEAVKIQAQTENSRRLGEILVSRGFIDRVDLESEVRRQIEELLYSLLSWRKGTFKFYENQFPTDEEITVDLSVENVILQGLRRVDESNLVKDTIGDLDNVFTLSSTDARRSRCVDLEGEEWNLLALVDNHRSVDEICGLSVLDREETLKKLARLKLSGLITKADKSADASQSRLETMVEHLSQLFEDYLTDRTGNRLRDQVIQKAGVETQGESYRDTDIS